MNTRLRQRARARTWVGDSTQTIDPHGAAELRERQTNANVLMVLQNRTDVLVLCGLLTCCRPGPSPSPGTRLCSPAASGK